MKKILIAILISVSVIMQNGINYLKINNENFKLIK